MEILIFLIYILAVWRISNLFVNESGPFDMFLRIRKLTGIVHDSQKRPVEIPDNVFAGVLSCVWCFSIWVAFFMTILIFVSPTASLIFELPFALSAGAIWVNKVMEK